MKNYISYIALAVAIIAIAMVLVGNQPEPQGAATGQQFRGTITAIEGIDVGSRQEMTVDSTGAITTKSNLNLSGAIACVNFNATSTATAGSLTFVTTGATSTYAGTVYWDYGSCN